MSIPVIDPNLKDWTQTLSWIAVIIGGLVALYKARHEIIENRNQRQRELRWKQAEAGKKLLDEMLSDSAALAAMKMLDWDDREYEYMIGEKKRISETEYIKALRITDEVFQEWEAYVRDCFGNLFYFMAMFEHYIDTELIVFEDVFFPLDYYYKKINKNREVFDRFLHKYELTRTVRFLGRMDEVYSDKLVF